MQHTPFTIQEMPAAHLEYPNWIAYNVRDSRNVCRAQIGNVDRATEGMNKQTAQLFAAAPDLLNACRDVMQKLDWAIGYQATNDRLSPQQLCELVDTLHAAIAKAGC